MKKEITESEAIKRLKKTQDDLRDIRDRCQTVKYWDIENAIRNIQEAKVLCAKQIGLPGY